MERKKIIRNVILGKCSTWYLKDDHINTVRKGKIQEVSEACDHTENHSGLHMAEFAAHVMASKKQREKETDIMGGQEDKVPTCTKENIPNDILNQ